MVLAQHTIIQHSLLLYYPSVLSTSSLQFALYYNSVQKNVVVRIAQSV
jgi:hypothetical protein